ncbi:galactose mutarotase-like enzyme [Sphaerochaeta pleomorpha str. Grapes]|uniref:Aldose 1-epimerase n=1 Tax=Sphaerochaeta pleomorpha (strain ATCC BAA-1885 / DSM 22778 / Grapes) TaxID=158190 RepID=G8QYC6_SPHPG|nr:aldose epimerase family protein [Sphaerochaeta pleomorpha]AEV30773.1 galactose mutarotase-like enzyme [Sphaerochaeta pleomorpha str. Grapes]
MLSKQSFGFTPDKEEILLVTLSNGPFSVEILSLGGIIRSLKTPDREGNIGDIVLGFDDPLENLKSTTYFGQIVGRFANRIAKGRYSIDGTEYQMETNDGPNALHNGKSNFGWRNWHVETFEWSGSPGVVLSLFSPDGDGGMPGSLNITVTYLLRSNGELMIEYEATTTKKTIVNMTNHSYFNLAGAANGTILDHEVKLECDHYLEVDKSLIPTGKILSVSGTPFDFTKAKPLGRDMLKAGGYDHCFVVSKHATKLFEFAQVYEPVSGRTMKISTTMPAVQMYTGNFLNGNDIGKGNVRYAKHAGVCFETQFFPDSPNHPNFPSCVLEPSSVYKHTTVFAFGAK